MFIVQQHYGCAVRIPYTSARPASIHHNTPNVQENKRKKKNQKKTEYLSTARFLHKKKRLK